MLNRLTDLSRRRSALWLANLNSTRTIKEASTLQQIVTVFEMITFESMFWTGYLFATQDWQTNNRLNLGTMNIAMRLFHDKRMSCIFSYSSSSCIERAGILPVSRFKPFFVLTIQFCSRRPRLVSCVKYWIQSCRKSIQTSSSLRNTGNKSRQTVYTYDRHYTGPLYRTRSLTSFHYTQMSEFSDSMTSILPKKTRDLVLSCSNLSPQFDLLTDHPTKFNALPNSTRTQERAASNVDIKYHRSSQGLWNTLSKINE